MSVIYTLEPVLEAGEIQGNILGGFNKDLQVFMFLSMPEASGLASIRRWLSACVDRVTWLDEVVTFKRAFHALAGGIPGADPDGLASTWMNVGFSHPALLRLAPDAAQFEPVFSEGMASAVGRLGDPMDQTVRGHISRWKFGARGAVPDIILIIAADRDEEMRQRLERERALVREAGLVEMHVDFGRDLGRTAMLGSFPAGREHFGFKDGVSQPAVRGRLSTVEDDFLTPRKGIHESGTTIEYASPGRPLVCPGEFVLGYPRQSIASGREAAEPWPLGEQTGPPGLTKLSTAPLWARNGSFLVYRRLNQDVPAFNRFLRESANELAKNVAFADLTPERFGAMVVGRWRSGAPLLRATGRDDERLALAPGANNDFGYLHPGSDADGFTGAVSDPAGEICPAASHIRKVNPRLLPTDQGGEVNSLVRRILRRGIPFGEPLAIGSELDPREGDRGLLFVSYQASIRDQFEFLQSFWANDDAKPTPQLSGKAGIDLILGQGRGPHRSRFALVGTDQIRVDAPEGIDWVFPTAGGYFFSPSRSAILDVLSASARDGAGRGRCSQGKSLRRKISKSQEHGKPRRRNQNL